MAAYNKLKHILESRRISTKLKIKTIDSYIKSIFLYNSEIWTLTQKVEESIDIFQRTLLRRILGIYWQDKVTNEELYERANTNKWSKDIKKRRLKWLGHLLRLPEDTPARQALQEAFSPVNRPRGRPKTTWISLVTKELKEMNIELTYDSLHEVVELANDRNAWRNLVGRAMSR